MIILFISISLSAERNTKWSLDNEGVDVGLMGFFQEIWNPESFFSLNQHRNIPFIIRTSLVGNSLAELESGELRLRI